MTSDAHHTVGLRAGQVIKAEDAEAHLSLAAREQRLRDIVEELRDRDKNAALEMQRRGFEHGVTKTIQKVANYVDHLNAMNQQSMERAMPLIVDLICDVLGEMIGQLDERDLATRLVRQHLKQLKPGLEVEIRVATELREAVLGAIQSSNLRDEGSVQVVPDDKMPAGKIIVKNAEGLFDLGIKQQTAIARQLFAKQLLIANSK